jgi:hypothetical protein
MKLFQKLAEYYYLPKLARIEKEIGYKLLFNHIPERYIPAVMSCEMTKTWNRFGLNVEKGLNHFTMGGVATGMSSRFDRNAPEYQSWLGGYTVKLKTDSTWSFKDHFKLAIADQNSWLRRYGDPSPDTTVEGWKLVEIDKIKIGEHTGTLYEYGCTTHSDVGTNPKTLSLLYGIYGMAALYNLTNPSLDLKANNFIPKGTGYPYEVLDLKGFIVIFDISTKVKIVLYGNGVIPNHSFRKDTLSVLKDDLLKAIKSCEVIIL